MRFDSTEKVLSTKRDPIPLTLQDEELWRGSFASHFPGRGITSWHVAIDGSRSSFVNRIGTCFWRRWVRPGAKPAGVCVRGDDQSLSLDSRDVGGQSREGHAEREGQTLNSTLKRGWYWGSENFREKLRGLLERQITRAHGEAEANRLLELGMEALGLSDPDIRKPVRGDLRRVAVTKVLDSRTTVIQKWIAEQLNMKSAANLSQQVCRFSDLPENHLPPSIRAWIKNVDIC
jgi:hypothetical protein